MSQTIVAAAAAAMLATVAAAGPRDYARSLPPPVVVMHDADLKAVLHRTWADRLRALVGGPDAGRSAGPKLIALTLDDGPYPVDTAMLLQALAGLHVHATFFLIGRDAEQFPGLVRAIAAAGHEIADHTETHPNLDQLGDAAVRAEVLGGAVTLGRLSGDPAAGRIFRPPHGRYRAATLATVQRAGFDTVLWTDDPGDWRGEVTSDSLALHVAENATSPEILLLHNGRPPTVGMLARIVRRFRKAGYTFVTVGELLRRVTPDQLNNAARTPLARG